MDGIVFRNGSVKTILSVAPWFETDPTFRRTIYLFSKREGGLCDGQECERVDLLDIGDSVVPQLLAIL
jgi:hypothetical protein